MKIWTIEWEERQKKKTNKQLLIEILRIIRKNGGE
jgi:hypothetical protein